MCLAILYDKKPYYEISVVEILTADCTGIILLCILYLDVLQRPLQSMIIFQQKLKCFPELQIRGGIADNSKTIFLISQGKHML